MARIKQNCQILLRKGLCVFVGFVFSLSLWAADFTVGGVAYRINSIQERTCNVTCHEYCNSDKYSGHVVIPKNVEYKGQLFTVVEIEDRAFEYCSKLLSITIPPTVKGIGICAFRYTGLAEINGDIKATIGPAAFAHCGSLRKIRIWNSNSIQEQAFYGCSALSEVLIEGTVMRIGEEAFAKCGQISKVEFKDGKSSLELSNDVFKGTLIENLYIGRNLSYNCGLNSPRYNHPFEQVVHITIGDSVTTLMDNIRISSSYRLDEAIKAYRYVLDTSVTKTVILGKSLTKAPVFWHARQLEKIVCRSATPPIVDGEFSYYVILHAILYVPKGMTDKYKKVSPWKDFIIKE